MSPPPDQELADELLIDAEEVPPAPPLPAVPRWVLAIAILCVACNLRPPLTSLGPVLNEIRADLPGLGTAAGLLTMLPVLCMGLAGPFAPILARRWGAERVVLGWLGVLAGGLALRGLGTPLPLFVGTAVIGCAIGIVGVLLPGVVKRDFRDHGTLMTGLFTMCLCWGAAFAAGIMVPLSQLLGGSWAWALAAWAVPAIGAALIAPILAGRARDQRGAVAVALGCTLAGLLGCLYVPLAGAWLWLAAAVLGVGQGAAFSVALTLIVLRAKDGHVAAQLSSMAQGVGYTLAAFCPMALGLLHDAAGSWQPAAPLFTAVAALALMAGLGAGRRLTLSGQE